MTYTINTTLHTQYKYNTTYTSKYNKNHVPRMSQCSRCDCTDWTALTKVLKGRLTD